MYSITIHSLPLHVYINNMSLRKSFLVGLLVNSTIVIGQIAGILVTSLEAAAQAINSRKKDGNNFGL